MRRRSWLFACAGLCGGLLLSVGGRVRAVDPPPLGEGLPKGFTFKQQLEKGLKARRPSDFTFISTVVTRVENGTLPQRLVNETFDYARAQSTQYPFIYFQFAIRKRAAKIGVTL